MASYGSTAKEVEPMLPRQALSHPAPGQGGWSEGEREWVGSVSMRHLRRPFFDPVLFQVSDCETVDVSKFKYLHETGLHFKSIFALPTSVSAYSVFISALLGIAILMDGLRPIVLVMSKGGETKYPYLFSIWVVLVKFLTVAFSLIMYFLAFRRGETQTNLSLAKRFALSVYLIVPVLCYVFSDVLNFVLFEHKVSPTLFACVKQSRIVITAVMYRGILKKNVSPIQWIAVLQLCLASLLFVAEDTAKAEATETVTDKADEMVGVLWLLFKCVLDSVSVVWMDKYFKVLDESGYPYAEQQVMFSVQSFISSVVFVVMYNGNEIFGGRPWFDGFNQAAWFSAFLTAFYGILVSLVLRYLDSMVKQFQALCSIVVTTLLDQYIFGQIVTLTDWVAIAVILISVLLYKISAAPGKIK